MKKIILVMITLIIIVLLSCQAIFASEQKQCKLDKESRTSSETNNCSYWLFPVNIVPNII